MGKIIAEVDTTKRNLKLEINGASNLDVINAIYAIIEDVAVSGVVSDFDLLRVCESVMDDAIKKCTWKICRKKEQPKKPESPLFSNFPDFDKLLRDTFGKGEGE